MEGRRLNFNAPLLSVRRYSATPVASPVGENGKRVEKPKPRRQYTIPFYKSDVNLEQVTEPVAVPFMWEQIPGRPKDRQNKVQYSEEDTKSPTLSSRMALDIIKYPSRKELESRTQIQSCLDENEGNDEKWNSDLENEDDVYSDALNTLSPTESLSINCSVTGMSESDGQSLKPSGTFSTDPQTRDFMMSRFLPAAKAMALEPPQYASKKQFLAIEQPKEVKVVTEERKPLINKSIVIPYYDQDVVEEETEDEGEGDDYDDSGNLSSKSCGLLPMLCFNKSLSLLNPVPGLKVRTHSSISSTSGVDGIVAHSLSIKKRDSNNMCKRQSDREVWSPKLTRMESKTTFGSKRLTSLTDEQMTNRLSPLRRGVSPYRNERPPSPFHGGGFLGMPKEPENLKDNRSNTYKKATSKSHELIPLRSLRNESGSRSPTVEKTLYVYTVNFAKVSSSNLSSLDTKKQMASLENAAEEPSSAVEVDSLNVEKSGSILQPRNSGPAENNQSSFSRTVGHDQECNSFEVMELTANANSREQSLAVVDSGYPTKAGSEQSPLPPPLPKTPSESWLWRTLPSVPARNSFSHSRGTRLLTKQQDSRKHLSNAKWETIVKSSYTHQDHVRYSEELSSHSPQQSKA